MYAQERCQRGTHSFVSTPARRRWALLAAMTGCALALAAGGCATTRAFFGVRPEPKIAQEMYEQAVDDMESGLYPEALKAFADLKTKYPYTKYAALADLRSADTQFHRAKYVEAVDGYRSFLKFHPNHEEAPYAMYQIVESYYQQIPDDWFFLPPAAEKDQGNTKLAIAGFNDMLARFPEGEVADRARARRDECRARLADHELYVAHFYLEREVYPAAAGRAEVLLNTYANLGYDEEALWIAGRSRYEAGEMDRARVHLQSLRQRFPESSWAGDAAALLAKIPTEPGPQVPAVPSAPDTPDEADSSEQESGA